MCEQQARRTAEAVETALAEEHRRQRVTLEGWLASLDDDGSEPEVGERAEQAALDAASGADAEADGARGAEAAEDDECAAFGATPVEIVGSVEKKTARVADIVAMFGGRGGRPSGGAAAGADVAAGGGGASRPGASTAARAEAAAAGAVFGRAGSADAVRDGASGTALAQDGAHGYGEEHSTEYSVESVESLAAVTAGGAGDVPIADAEERTTVESDELQAAVTAGGECDGPIVDAEERTTVVSAGLQAAMTAGGAADHVDVENRHPEESDELRAAMTAGGAPDGPIVTVEVPQPTLAEIERAADDENSQGWQSAGRRRRGGARSALPTPPPSRSNARRPRQSSLPENAPQEVDSVVAAIRDGGGYVEGVWHDGEQWRILADSRSADFLRDCLEVLVGRTDIVVDGEA